MINVDHKMRNLIILMVREVGTVIVFFKEITSCAIRRILTLHYVWSLLKGERLHHSRQLLAFEPLRLQY